ncbi:hypothetical protein BH11MYX1_BH11MYX1_05410 [soil metagenome]
MIGLIFSGLIPMFRRAAPAAADPDGEFVRRAVVGNRRAFDELYRAHVGSAYRLLTRLVGPVPERDDLIQQVFLEAFRALPRFRGEAASKTWLHRIVVNHAYRHLRRAKRVRFEEVSDELPAPDASPELATRRRQELAVAVGYLSALKPKKRIAYVLRVVEGLSLDEIGVLVGANAPAVGQRIKHAQRELAVMVDRDRIHSESCDDL